MNLQRKLALIFGAALLLGSAACGGDSLEESNSGGTTPDETATDKGALTISGQNFTEMQIMAAMYAGVLSNAGYDVDTKLVDTRDVYVQQMTDGKVDVVPEYLAGIADFLNTEANGENAETITSNDPQATIEGLKPLADEAGITMLEPSEATDQNAYAVTQQYADDNSLTTLSDLGALGEPIKLAAAPDCVGRQDCEKGLTDVYGIDISEVVPLGFGSAQTKDALDSGEVELGQTGTTDGSLADLGLVLLEDDKGLQPAQNLIPAINSDFLAEQPDAADLLNELSSTLTTDDLATLNAMVDLERQKPEDVADQYLTDKGLI